jgi:hypothetical protein
LEEDEDKQKILARSRNEPEPTGNFLYVGRVTAPKKVVGFESQPARIYPGCLIECRHVLGILENNK